MDLPPGYTKRSWFCSRDTTGEHRTTTPPSQLQTETQDAKNHGTKALDDRWLPIGLGKRVVRRWVAGCRT
jgi:hypothetical protein